MSPFHRAPRRSPAVRLAVLSLLLLLFAPALRAQVACFVPPQGPMPHYFSGTKCTASGGVISADYIQWI